MKNKLLLLLIALSAIFSSRQAWAATTFRFKLDKNCRTSAGVYKTDGTLIKVLWKKRPLSAGQHSATWDNTDESGAAQPAGNYQIKLIAHNVNYVWEGVLGNTSDKFTGKTVHHVALRPGGLAINGTNAFFASSFNEGQPLWTRFNTGSPQSVVAKGRVDAARDFRYVATDGTNVYFANTGNGWISEIPSFVVANKVSDNSEVTFSSGVVAPAPNPPAEVWNSVIDWQTGAANAPTGLAVQYNSGGNILAVSHSGMNAVRLLNKTTGAFISSLSVTAPGAISFAPNGDLWVICTNAGVRVARRYNNLSTTPALATTITGLVDPLAIAIDQRTTADIVAIADGGASQQVKAFNSTGTSLWTYGQAGGYANGPTVTNDKFWFRAAVLDGNVSSTLTYLAFAPDGSFWVEDRGNRRAMHFSAARAYIDQIAFSPASRVATVDPNNPSRVFSNFLEYQVDYSKPLAPANGSWTLVRNWGYGHPQGTSDAFGFYSVNTLSNGRTYAVAGSPWENAGAKIYELNGTTMRDTGLTLNDIYFDGVSIEPDGSLQYQTFTTTTVSFCRKPLASFDANNNPVWGAQVVLASAPTGANDPYYKKMYSFSNRTKVTSNDVVVTFDPSNSTDAASTSFWHLGGVQKNGTDWLWKASKTGWTDGLGSFQNQAIDTTINAPGNTVNVLERNVLYGFHGEFWTYQLAGNEGVGQANQTMHFYDNGLFVGQFGQPGYSAYPGLDEEPIAGVTGNALTWSIVRSPLNGEAYLYSCEESGHGGVHRWLIDGVNNITEMVGTGPKDGTIQLGCTGSGLKGEYYDNADLTTLKTTRIDKTVNFDWGASKATAEQTDADTFSVRWTGKVEAPVTGNYVFTTRTDDGVRLWINGVLRIDKWIGQGATDWSSAAISLTGGQKYEIKMEYYDDTSDASSKLSWAYPGQAQQIIPQARLYPPDNTVYGTGTGLTGDYYSDTNFTTKVLTRNDAEINFNWVYQNAAPGQDLDNYSIRWNGEIQAVETGTYTLEVVGDDSMKLWVGNTTGTALIDKPSYDPLRQSATIAMTAGQKYPIKIEFKEFGGKSAARLEWIRPGHGDKVFVPQSQLYPAQYLDDLPSTLPLPPTALNATAGNAQVALSWTTGSGATSYNIYRGTTSGGQSATAIVTGITGTTYTNTGLTNGSTYYYIVRAVNSSGTSSDSNEATATPAAPITIPAAPTSLTATAGNTQIVLNWAASSGATSYNIYRGTTSNGQSATAITTGITGTTYTNTGLTNGTAYYYKVKAVNSAGTSADSNEASATPSAAANIAYTATAPTIDATVDSLWSAATTYNVTTVVNGTTSISGNWKAMWNSSKLYILATVSDSSLLSASNDYNGDAVEIYVDADNSKTATYGANDFQYILGWNASSASLSEYAHNATTGVTFAQATISGGYRMEFAIPWTTLGVTPVANNLVGFDVGMDDAASVSARAGQVMWFGTSNNFQNPSLFGTGILMPPPVPAAPTGLTATAGNAQVVLNWTATSGATSYNVYRGTTSNGQSATAVATGVTATTYTNTGLSNATTYYYKIKAVNAGGTSAYSNEASATPNNLPASIIALRLNENTGTTTANNGSAGGSLALSSTVPTWSTNVPTGIGGASGVDFGTTTGNYAVESPAAISALGGLTKFTITGWVNCRNNTEGAGGNRVVTWINNGGDGVDLVYKTDGNLQLSVDEWPDSSPAISSTAKVPTSSTAVASNWKYFAVTYDSTLATNQVNFYFGDNSTDATLDVARTYSGRGAVNTSIGRLALGHFNSATRSGATDRMFRGLIDNVKIYGDALTLSQVVQAQRIQ